MWGFSQTFDMCGRFSLHTLCSSIAERYFSDAGLTLEDMPPRYNVCPGTRITIIRGTGDATTPGITWDAALWGFRPRWAHGRAPAPINAKLETAMTNHFFVEAYRERRCLVPANGWFEWQERAHGKQPWYITLADNDDDVLFLGGIWEPAGDDGVVRCAILTEPANAQFAAIHNRQPLVLDPGCRQDWLDGTLINKADIADATRPLDASRLHAYRVSTEVNSPANDSEAVLAPLAADAR